MNSTRKRLNGYLALVGFAWLLLAVILDKYALPVKAVSSLCIAALTVYLYSDQIRQRLFREKRVVLTVFVVLSMVLYVLLVKKFSSKFLEYKRLMLLILSQIPVYMAVMLYAVADAFDEFLSSRYADQSKIYDRIGLFALLLVVGLITFYSPLTIHTSDPESLPFPLWQLILWHGAYFLVISLVGVLVYRTAPVSLRMILAPAAAALAIVGWVYTYLLPGDYGLLDVVIFTKPGNLIGLDRLYTWKDWLLKAGEAAALLAVLAGIFWAVLYKTRRVLPLVLILNLMTLGQTAFNVASSPQAWFAGATGSAYLPSTTDTVFRLSRKQNVLVFMFDMFNGGLVREIFDKYPELKKSFTGFTWYKNTIPHGWATYAGLPGILGGEQFSPRGVAQRPGIEMTERLEQAYSFYPKLFGKQGFDVTWVHPVYFNLADKSRDWGITVTEPDSFSEYWLNTSPEAKRLNLRMTSAAYSRLFTVIGLFKASPFFLRPYIYIEGRWLNLNRGGLDSRHAMMHLSFLDLLTKLTKVDDGPPVFKFIDNELTHTPWAIDKDLKLSPDGRTNMGDGSRHTRAFFSAARALQEVAQYLDLMRAEDVYDKTKIVLVSDHGFYAPDPMWTGFSEIRARDGTFLKESGAGHSLLMVKDFNSDGPFTSDARLMSTSDTAFIVRAALPDPEYRAADPTKHEDPDRTVYMSFTPVPPEENGKYEYYINHQFAVHGDPADWDNWRQTIP